MSKADEMFKELGYEKAKTVNHFCKDKNKDTDKNIDFDIDLYGNKSISVYSYDKIDKEYLFEEITMQELQAINKKCEELGWL